MSKSRQFILETLLSYASSLSPNAKVFIPMMKPQIEKQLMDTPDGALFNALMEINVQIETAIEYLTIENERVTIQ